MDIVVHSNRMSNTSVLLTDRTLLSETTIYNKVIFQSLLNNALNVLNGWLQLQPPVCGSHYSSEANTGIRVAHSDLLLLLNAAPAWIKDCAHRNTGVKNAQLLGGTSPSGSLPRLGGRNPIADLSLNSQASAINSADKSKRRRKPAQRLTRSLGSPAAESGALDGAGCWLERKTGLPKRGFHCTATVQGLLEKLQRS